jgi:hypothetical protein
VSRVPEAMEAAAMWKAAERRIFPHGSENARSLWWLEESRL